MKNICLLGASGSIGRQTLDVLKNMRDSYKLVGFSVGENWEFANDILNEFPEVKIASVKNKEDVSNVNLSNVTFGEQGLVNVATFLEADIVVTAVVGSVGLVPTIEAIKCNKDIALANKETLVMAGHIVMKLAREKGVNILPVDSEHSAIFQCLNGEDKKYIKNIVITASGGSFRNKSLEELKYVTKKEALNHPNWEMGDKITIDSATMINKGLEVIEAHHLFDIEYDSIKTILHKESIVHSMVEFKDNAVIAQLGSSDMRGPISYALCYPKRGVTFVDELNLAQIGSLNFEEIDFDRFEGLKLSYWAGRQGHSYPSVLNAANEAAVDLFLNDKIEFLDIISIIKEELERHEIILDPKLEELIDLTNKIKERIKREYWK